jgi:hypothetical protein
MDYSLGILCGGNKNELSRRLEYRRGDLNRMLKRLNDGVCSIRATEAVLKLLCAEQCSLDQILTGYEEPHDGASDGGMRLACDDMMRILLEQMANNCRTAGQKMRVLQSADTFMEQLVHTFCTDLCRMRDGRDAECPCKRFADLVAWIQMELDAEAHNGEIEAGLEEVPPLR